MNVIDTELRAPILGLECCNRSLFPLDFGRDFGSCLLAREDFCGCNIDQLVTKKGYTVPFLQEFIHTLYRTLRRNEDPPYFC